MIQIDMQMPGNCLNCKMRNDYFCVLKEKYFDEGFEGWNGSYIKERPPWCPLQDIELVMCKNCQYGEPINGGMMILCHKQKRQEMHDLDWFCADGVAKDINVPDKEGRWSGMNPLRLRPITDKQKKHIDEMQNYSPYPLPKFEGQTRGEAADYIDKYGKLAHESEWAIEHGYD